MKAEKGSLRKIKYPYITDKQCVELPFKNKSFGKPFGLNTVIRKNKKRIKDIEALPSKDYNQLSFQQSGSNPISSCDMTAFTVLPIDDIKSTGTPLNLYSTEIQFNDKGKVVNLNQQVEDFNYLTKKKPFKQPI